MDGRRRMVTGVLIALGAGMLLATVPPATAAAERFASPRAQGPAIKKLGHSKADRRASLTCTDDLDRSGVRPVLLLSATTVDPDENFAWNWMPALSRAGIPWCASTAPEPDNMADIQPRGEYVVYAIRAMHRRSGKRIAIYGHSQGGMVGRWALRFWRNTRRMVADVVGAAPSNRGTDGALATCTRSCAPAVWQQRTGSRFITALNSHRETHKRVSYTNIYTRLDQVVFPNQDETGRSSLSGPARVSNVAVQEICPASASEHLAIGTIDPVTWALFIDAITHPGPADPARLPAGICGRQFMPGVDRATVASDITAAAAALATTSATYPGVEAEPPLRDYVFADRR
jgi:pimeloyl-ACP methyl ester carboxylesterase